MKKTILIAGGAGYIGSHAILAIRERGESIVAYDNFSAGEPVMRFDGVEYVQGDTGDAAALEKAFTDFSVDTVMHFAAFIRVDESVREPEKYLKNNVENTRVLVDTAKKSGIEHFIYSSSAAVYGNPVRVPAQEDDPTVPINPYGESKLQAEKIVMESTVASVALRYFNAAGADSKGRAGYRIEKQPSHLIRSCIRALLDGKTYTINGNDYPTPDHTCVRDYIHVSDLAKAHVEALEYLRQGGASRVYNCGLGKGFSNLEVVQAVGRVAGKELPYVFGPQRPGDPAELIADVSRIKKELGWQPAYELEDMIRDELAWVRARMHTA